MTYLKDKNILITGSASGIGRIMAEMAIKKSAKNLVLWDINSDKLKSTKKELSSTGQEPLIYNLNVSETQNVIETLKNIKEKIGSIDILINNAGIIIGKPFEKHSHKEIDDTMAINTNALMHITLEILQDMKAKGYGHIVNISSAASMLSNPNMSVYCASKWAVSGWSDSLRLELERSQSNIKVTTVTPYYISTGMFEGVKSPLIPILNPKDTAKKIIQAIEKNKIFLRMPKILYLLPLLRGILPGRIFDLVVGKLLGIYRSMDSFRSN